MALIYFYDATELDKTQLSDALKDTDHHWEYVDEKLTTENLHPDTEVVSVFVSSTVTREIMDSMPRLRLIACRSTGFNNVDLVAAAERDITIVNVPTYGDATVAEYAFTLILSLTRKISAVLHAESSIVNQESMRGTDLRGKTIAVIGTGHIGQRAIEIAKGFSMQVVAYDPFPKDELANALGFTYMDIDEALKAADVITLHAPYTAETHHLINAARLNLCKPSAIIINTARGELIDTKALVTALEDGRIAAAGLDVVEGEALLQHSEEQMLLRSTTINQELLRHSVEISVLKKLPNVLISPHNAFNTVEAVGRINLTTAQNIIDYWYGHVPNRVSAKQSTSGKLLLARHAESEWNATGQWTGITDVHLSEKGFHEDALLGLLLKDLGISIDLAYCSQQIRTRETLQGMLNAAQLFDVPISREAAINERDYGDYTGKNKWEMKELLGEEAFNNLRRGWDVPVPNGETLKMVYERVVPFYTQTLLPNLQAGKNILVVAHGNSIRALMKYIENLNEDQVASLEMLFGQIVMYTPDADGHSSEKVVRSIDSPPPNA